MGLEGWSIVVMALLIGATQATEYKVGDSFGWNVPTNQSFYSDWAASISNYQTFSVGDKLVFNWTGTHNVANVSKDDYENCSAAASPWGSSANDTSYLVNITESGPHLYICTVGNHCAESDYQCCVSEYTRFLCSNSLSLWTPICICLYLSCLFLHSWLS
ncbi:hypothetical protein L6164_021038 [Bauhinia variegata]|uniref:Uncharacterized protein n=1 Tax=Bauhinia variegata TaxID=167791 RepID=A0ACB9MX99_BAUVA|nr:hypothetical protein L6164_021038 [Bauhinia variegata]